MTEPSDTIPGLAQAVKALREAEAELQEAHDDEQRAVKRRMAAYDARDAADLVVRKLVVPATGLRLRSFGEDWDDVPAEGGTP